jgi:pimeloyl-ACP methyl ester carboxylesterase
MSDQANPPHRPPPEHLLRDGGRRVAIHWLAAGTTGRVLVLCHPAPGAGAFDPVPEQTWARGVDLLSVDRPGYGASDPVAETEWASVSSAADDLAAVLDHIGRRPYGVAGWSAGGRVALALAARRPDLLDRIVVLATPAPHEQVPWVAPEQQAVLEQIRDKTPAAARAALSRQFAQIAGRGVSAEDRLSLLAASAADATVLADPGGRARLESMLEAAFAQGATGLADDIAGYSLQPWGFEPGRVRAKTLLLHGSRDPVAANRHASWWHKQISGSRVEMVPGAGHLLIFSMWERVLSHLAPNLRRTP